MIAGVAGTTEPGLRPRFFYALQSRLPKQTDAPMPTNALPLFRQAHSSDIPAMSRIRLSVTENVLSDPSRVTAQMYEDFLEKSGRGWVAEDKGEIVAFCYADKDHASIWALFVCPGHEGRGLAKTLLRLAVDWLFATGHEAVSLSTGAGTRADRFYAAQGWLRRPVSATEIAYSLGKPAPDT
jgi:GNAT superfamily N-acetyltransferase